MSVTRRRSRTASRRTRAVVEFESLARELALELAVSHLHFLDASPSSVVERAKAYADFLIGKEARDA